MIFLMILMSEDGREKHLISYQTAVVFINSIFAHQDNYNNHRNHSPLRSCLVVFLLPSALQPGASKM